MKFVVLRNGVVFLGLAGHDVEDHLVGGAHGVGADDGEVADAAVDVVVDDALGTGDVAAFHGQHGTQQGGRHARRNLQGTAGLGTVTDHAREIGNHVLDCIADAVEAAAHEVGDAAGAADGGDDTAAQGAEFA